MDGTKKNQIKIGATVDIVLKKDQRTGTLTTGTVAKILTNSSSHPHGIKVMLSDGQVGRVKSC
ncbi:MAG: YwbE family protein [Bacillota bacterium]